jgi:UDP-3-O-[3-hydroxymyristoyl] N-acetylglucosamine deacetylase
MTPFRQQTTISQPVAISGFGFWSGDNVNVEFRPAQVHSGIVFVRSDLTGQPRIPAVLQNRITGPRRTTLAYNGAQVEMVEHLLAALAGLQIDNCEVHLDSAEVPGLDGSSNPFVEALRSADIVRLPAVRSVMIVREPVRIQAGDSWIEAKPLFSRQFRINYHLHYPMAPAIGQQAFSVDVTPQSFVDELAPARTFLLESEANQLQAQGLGQRVSFTDVLVFDSDGPIKNALRYSNECVRHKMLDIVGDFALSGRDWIGEITAFRTGHELNAQLVSVIAKQNRNLENRYSA